MQVFDKLDPKGYVVIKDKDGKILRANYNTIVNEGKKTLIAKLLSNFIQGDTVSSIGVEKNDMLFDFHGLCFGSNMSETSTETSFSTNSNEYNEFIEENGNKIENPLYFKFAKDFKEDHTSDHGVSEFMVYFDEDAKRWYLSTTVRVIPGSINSTDNISLNWKDENFKNSVCSLAIIMKKGEGDAAEYRLFSRFRFDPVPITSDSEFILTYYIYF